MDINKKILEVKFKGKLIDISKTSKGISVPKTFWENGYVVPGKKYEVLIKKIEDDDNG